MRAVSKWALSSVTALFLAATVLAGTGVDMVSQEELMHKVQIARTRADHEEIVSIYEKQMSADLAAAEEHRRMGNVYKEMGSVYQEPDAASAGRSTFGSMAAHCDSLVEMYTLAAKEHGALAKLHRDAAAKAH